MTANTVKACLMCSKEITRRARGKRDKLRFCSQQCSCEWRKRITRYRVSVTTKRSKCMQCGAQAHGKKYCSSICASRYRHASDVASGAYGRQKAEQRAKHAVIVGLNDIDCPECGTSFTVVGKARVYCSNVCSRTARNRVHDKRRDKRIRSATVESVDPNKVFERDGWKCMLCDTPTPRGKRGLHLPDSPELDHIIPLSKGGEHSYRNTQCLCRSCNGAKSDSMPAAFILG